MRVPHAERATGSINDETIIDLAQCYLYIHSTRFLMCAFARERRKREQNSEHGLYLVLLRSILQSLTRSIHLIKAFPIDYAIVCTCSCSSIHKKRSANAVTQILKTKPR